MDSLVFVSFPFLPLFFSCRLLCHPVTPFYTFHSLSEMSSSYASIIQNKQIKGSFIFKPTYCYAHSFFMNPIHIVTSK